MIHLYFEEDITPRYENEIEIKSAVRKQLYALLYEQEYSYGVTNRSKTSTGAPEPPPMPDLPPEEMPLKPFIPPTEFEDFQAAGLDAPLGGM